MALPLRGGGGSLELNGSRKYFFEKNPKKSNFFLITSIKKRTLFFAASLNRKRHKKGPDYIKLKINP